MFKQHFSTTIAHLAGTTSLHTSMRYTQISMTPSLSAAIASFSSARILLVSCIAASTHPGAPVHNARHVHRLYSTGRENLGGLSLPAITNKHRISSAAKRLIGVLFPGFTRRLTDSHKNDLFSHNVLPAQRTLQPQQTRISVSGSNNGHNRPRRGSGVIDRQLLVEFASEYDRERINQLQKAITQSQSLTVCLDHFAENWNEYYGDNVAALLQKCASELEKPPSPIQMNTTTFVPSSISPPLATSSMDQLAAIKSHVAWEILLRRASQKVNDCTLNSFRSLIVSLNALKVGPDETTWENITKRIRNDSKLFNTLESTELTNTLYQISVMNPDNLHSNDELKDFFHSASSIIAKDISSVRMETVCLSAWVFSKQNIQADEFYNAFFEHLKGEDLDDGRIIKVDTNRQDSVGRMANLSSVSLWQIAYAATRRGIKDLDFFEKFVEASIGQLASLPIAGLSVLVDMLQTCGGLREQRGVNSDQSGHSTGDAIARGFTNRHGVPMLSKSGSRFATRILKESISRPSSQLNPTFIASLLQALSRSSVPLDYQDLSALFDISGRDISLYSSEEIRRLVQTYGDLDYGLVSSRRCADLISKITHEVRSRIDGHGGTDKCLGSDDLALLVGVLDGYTKMGYTLSPLYKYALERLESSLDNVTSSEAMQLMHSLACARLLTSEVALRLIQKVPSRPSLSREGCDDLTKAAWAISVTSSTNNDRALRSFVNHALMLVNEVMGGHRVHTDKSETDSDVNRPVVGPLSTGSYIRLFQTEVARGVYRLPLTPSKLSTMRPVTLVPLRATKDSYRILSASQKSKPHSELGQVLGSFRLSFAKFYNTHRPGGGYPLDYADIINKTAFQFIADSECVTLEKADRDTNASSGDNWGQHQIKVETEVMLEQMRMCGWDVMPITVREWKSLPSMKEKTILVNVLLAEQLKKLKQPERVVKRQAQSRVQSKTDVNGSSDR